MEWTGLRGEKSDISGETKLTWANKIYKRIDQNFSRKFISINRYVHHYQGTDSPPIISLLIFVSPPLPPPLPRHPVMIGQKLQLRKAAFCLVSLPPSHINLFVSPPIIIYKTWLAQYSIYPISVAHQFRVFIEFLPIALVLLGPTLPPLSHDKLSINSGVAIGAVSKERRKCVYIWPHWLDWPEPDKLDCKYNEIRERCWWRWWGYQSLDTPNRGDSFISWNLGNCQ